MFSSMMSSTIEGERTYQRPACYVLAGAINTLNTRPLHVLCFVLEVRWSADETDAVRFSCEIANCGKCWACHILSGDPHEQITS